MNGNALATMDIPIPVNKNVWNQAYEQYLQKPLSNGENDLSPISKEQFNQFVSWQDEVSGTIIRIPCDRDFFDKFTPYLEGNNSYEDCEKGAKEFLDIYVSE